MSRYDVDVLRSGPRRRAIPETTARRGLVVEDPATGFCGAIVEIGKAGVTVEDRRGRTRLLLWQAAGFLIDGVATTLLRPEAATEPVARPRTASGSFAVADAPARTARASRLWVEGDHDAALVERVWGDDLRVEGIVVEPIRGLDNLPALVGQFGPGPHRRIGVLADHLVPGSKETRIAAGITSPHVLVTGHPYVDIWQAVKPRGLGIAAWPVVERGRPWKDGIAAALGYDDPREVWRRTLAAVSTYADVEVPLLRAVEELIDFVTATRT